MITVSCPSEATRDAEPSAAVSLSVTMILKSYTLLASNPDTITCASLTVQSVVWLVLFTTLVQTELLDSLYDIVIE